MIIRVIFIYDQVVSYSPCGARLRVAIGSTRTAGTTVAYVLDIFEWVIRVVQHRGED